MSAGSIWAACVAIVVLLVGQAVYLDVPGSVVERNYALPSSLFVDVAGTRTHYTDSGARGAGHGATALPILLLHGTGSSLHTWTSWVVELTRPGLPFRVIRCDLPGCVPVRVLRRARVKPVSY